MGKGNNISFSYSHKFKNHDRDKLWLNLTFADKQNLVLCPQN